MNVNQLEKLLNQFSAQAIIFDEGDEGDFMYFIHEGEVQIEKKIGQNFEPVALLEKGDFFGEMALLESGNQRSARARAVTNCALLKVNSHSFEKLLSSNIEIAIRMIRKYTEKLKKANSQIEHLIKENGAKLAEPTTENSDTIADHNHRNAMEALAQRSINQSAPPSPSENLALLQDQISHKSFFLKSYMNYIGRVDPVTNIAPDLDLTELDTDRSVSRRHAKIFFEDAQVYLMEELGVANGTFINGKRIEPAQKVKISSGDELQFGDVKLAFRI